MAKAAGADVTVNMSRDGGALEKFTKDKGTFDLLYECSGAQVALVGAIAAMRPRGTILQLGLGGDMTLPMMSITAKELSLKGSFRFHEEFATGISLMRKGLIDVKPLITHGVALDDAHSGFALANDRSKAMKVHIQFS